MSYMNTELLMSNLTNINKLWWLVWCWCHHERSNFQPNEPHPYKQKHPNHLLIHSAMMLPRSKMITCWTLNLNISYNKQVLIIYKVTQNLSKYWVLNRQNEFDYSVALVTFLVIICLYLLALIIISVLIGFVWIQ